VEQSRPADPVAADQRVNVVRRLCITSSDNRRSGCWMGLWLVKDRVLAEDQYQVDVFDGPVFPEPPPEPPE
jgi:hypothetical protein